LTGDPGESPNPFRRPGFIVAAGFLAIVVVLGVIVAATRSPGDSSHPGLGAHPPAPGAGGGNAPSTCRPADTSQQIPTTTPAGVTWELFQAIAVPASAAAGPLKREGDLRSCYAHTPTGALIAATQIEPRLTYSSSWRQILDRQVMDGAGKNAFLADRKAKGVPGVLPAGGVAQYAGFKFVTYSPDTAVIDVANRLGPDTWVSGISTVKWRGGDWKLEIRPDGTPSAEGQDLSSLTGYVPWGGA
jgi:hypothetical protein